MDAHAVREGQGVATGTHAQRPQAPAPVSAPFQEPARSSREPEQRRRTMSDKFMMFTYKIKMCKRQDPHNWRLCPYAHPGEAGRRRPPHMHQPVMCDFGKTRKECSHGEDCPLARNALEFWLHPDKYRTLMCGHGEACNRNVCFFAHNEEELRAPGMLQPRSVLSSMPPQPPAAAAAAAAASSLAAAMGRISLAPSRPGSSQQAMQQPQLSVAPGVYAAGMGPAAGAPAFAVLGQGAGGAQQQAWAPDAPTVQLQQQHGWWLAAEAQPHVVAQPGSLHDMPAGPGVPGAGQQGYIAGMQQSQQAYPQQPYQQQQYDQQQYHLHPGQPYTQQQYQPQAHQQQYYVQQVLPDQQQYQQQLLPGPQQQQQGGMPPVMVLQQQGVCAVPARPEQQLSGDGGSSQQSPAAHLSAGMYVVSGGHAMPAAGARPAAVGVVAMQQPALAMPAQQQPALALPGEPQQQHQRVQQQQQHVQQPGTAVVLPTWQLVPAGSFEQQQQQQVLPAPQYGVQGPYQLVQQQGALLQPPLHQGVHGQVMLAPGMQLAAQLPAADVAAEPVLSNVAAPLTTYPPHSGPAA